MGAGVAVAGARSRAGAGIANSGGAIVNGGGGGCECSPSRARAHARASAPPRLHRRDSRPPVELTIRARNLSGGLAGERPLGAPFLRANGMAASDNNPSSDPPAPVEVACLSGSALDERLREEINRADRHGTPLACLLVTFGNLAELTREHGDELAEQAFAYAARVLASQVRDFDRIGRPSVSELVLVLPGADGPRGEIVARRVLERLRTIKVETDGTRRPLRIAVGLAAWEKDLNEQELLERTRAAARRGAGVEPSSGVPSSSPPALGRPHGSA